MRRVSTRYSIKWFRENTTGAVKDLGIGDPIDQQGTDRISRYHDTAFINQPYSPSLLGKYWCQVINRTADPDQPLMRSNVFTLLAPGDYSGPTCSEVQREANLTCADLSHNSGLATTHQSTTMTALPTRITLPAHHLPTHTLPHVTTPIQLSAAQEKSFIIAIIAVMGVVIFVIVCLVIVTVVMILFIKRRQNRSKTNNLMSQYLYVLL